MPPTWTCHVKNSLFSHFWSPITFSRCLIFWYIFSSYICHVAILGFLVSISTHTNTVYDAARSSPGYRGSPGHAVTGRDPGYRQAGLPRLAGLPCDFYIVFVRLASCRATSCWYAVHIQSVQLEDGAWTIWEWKNVKCCVKNTFNGGLKQTEHCDNTWIWFLWQYSSVWHF
jgi:hypothetical protein